MDRGRAFVQQPLKLQRRGRDSGNRTGAPRPLPVDGRGIKAMPIYIRFVSAPEKTGQ